MKTFLRWLAILVATALLLVAAAYVANGLHGTAELAKAKKAAVADLAESLPQAKVQAVRDRDQVRAAYASTWGQPAYAWQELVCELDSVDAGWIVQDYNQECRIRSVDLIPTTTVAQGERCTWTPIPPGDPAADSGSAPRPGGMALTGPSSAFDDAHPYASGCPGGIVGPQPYAASRMLAGHRPKDLGASPGWIVVTVTTDVSTTRLGCDPWALVFCSEPVDHPVLGDVG